MSQSSGNIQDDASYGLDEFDISTVNPRHRHVLVSLWWSHRSWWPGQAAFWHSLERYCTACNGCYPLEHCIFSFVTIITNSCLRLRFYCSIVLIQTRMLENYDPSKHLNGKDLFDIVNDGNIVTKWRRWTVSHSILPQTDTLLHNAFITSTKYLWIGIFRKKTFHSSGYMQIYNQFPIAVGIPNLGCVSWVAIIALTVVASVSLISKVCNLFHSASYHVPIKLRHIYHCVGASSRGNPWLQISPAPCLLTAAIYWLLPSRCQQQMVETS